MTHLTLVENKQKTQRNTAIAGTARPAPTDEFLSRRVLSLKLGDATIRELLTEAARLLKSEDSNALRRFSEVTNQLMFAGVWFIPFDVDDYTPAHGLVSNAQTLSKYHRELKRNLAQLNGLELHF